MSSLVMDPPPAAEKTAQEKNAEYNEKQARTAHTLEDKRREADAATIKSVKFIDGKIRISYSVIENNATRDIMENSADEPCESFMKALRALTPFVAELIFHDKKEREYQAPNITIKGVNFKHHDDDNMHAGIVAMLGLNTGHSTNLNIPVMPLYPEEDHKGGYSQEAAEAIEEVLEQTKDFLAGRRANGNLFAKLDN